MQLLEISELDAGMRCDAVRDAPINCEREWAATWKENDAKFFTALRGSELFGNGIPCSTRMKAKARRCGGAPSVTARRFDQAVR